MGSACVGLDSEEPVLHIAEKDVTRSHAAPPTDRRIKMRTNGKRSILGVTAVVALLGIAALAPSIDRAAQANDKVTLCHRTASAKNPYIMINVSINAQPAP